MSKRTKQRDKIIRVIKSCTSAEHIPMCQELVRNFRKMYVGQPMGDVIDFDPDIDHFMLRKELSLTAGSFGVYIEPPVEPSLSRRYIPPVSVF